MAGCRGRLGWIGSEGVGDGLGLTCILDGLEQFLHHDGQPLLVQLALAHYQFEVIQAASHLGVTRPTAHAAIDALVERGDLVEITGRERWRINEAPRILEAVYGE